MNDAPQAPASLFRSCPGCGRRWATLHAFLSDPLVALVGYQVNFERLEAGFFLFNHMAPNCGTTLAAQVGDFKCLYKGPIFRECHNGTASCTGYCLKGDMFSVCPNKCECAYVRVILDIVRQWPKNKSS